VASKGRAARLGERALGHLDPGAASAVVILKAMAITFCGGGAKQIRIVRDQSPGGVRFPGRRFKTDGDKDSVDNPPESLSVRVG